jgi:hypothetical protein
MTRNNFTEVTKYNLCKITVSRYNFGISTIISNIGYKLLSTKARYVYFHYYNLHQIWNSQNQISLHKI